jgi:hypothetical protein
LIDLSDGVLLLQPSVKIGDLVHQFTAIAEVLAQIIVDELPRPDAKKLIPPVNLGGVAGGAKYISHGILFKFAIDSAQLYGGDEFAMKATQHEIKGLTAYINYSLNSRFPNTLHFPLMTVIGTVSLRKANACNAKVLLLTPALMCIALRSRGGSQITRAIGSVPPLFSLWAPTPYANAIAWI